MDDLALAHRLADQADAISTRCFAARNVSWQAKSDGSPVTAADREIERALRAALAETRPGDAFLGEEFGARGAAAARRRWILDAVDGTASFVAGEPEWGTLIALVERDSVRLGLVSSPACGKRWWAARGSGAWYADLPVDGPLREVSAPSDGDGRHRTLPPRRLAITPAATAVCDASIAIWPPPSRLSPDHRAKAHRLAAFARTVTPALDWSDPVPPSAPIRKPSTGSGTCHGALLVATGRHDAFLLLGAGTWDIAPLIPIVEEAGGVYRDLGGEGSTASALFCVPGLEDEILGLIG